MKTIRIKAILALEPKEQELTVEGWIRTIRDSGAFAFFEVNDGSSLKGLQVIVDKDSEAKKAAIALLGTGASVRAKGRLVVSQGKGQKSELKADSVELVGACPQEEYPIQKKKTSFEFLREVAHLRSRTNTFGAVMRVRNAAAASIHQFFQERGFLYLNTPIVTASDCEGAGAMFQVTTLPLDKLPLTDTGAVDYSKDFFGKKAGLTVSGQLEAETFACALRDVYTFGPTFRAENSNTTRHLAEFWMVEPEMAFCDIVGNMDTAEEFIKFVIKSVLERCPDDMDFFNEWIEKGVLDTVRKVMDSPFVRITYTEAVKQLEKSGRSFEYPVGWGKELQSEHEKFLTEQVYNSPVIVTDYPKGFKAFYMKQNEDGKTVRAMDVLVPRLGEIIGGSERESDLGRLERRLDELSLRKEDYWWYLDLRRFGSVPHAGFGLGFERFILYITGMGNIRDVIPFPRAVGSADF